MGEYKEVGRMIGVVGRLRRECPWDRAQTHRSLTRYLIEEAHEAVEAIESGDVDSIKEELGDVLLQVVLHAEIAKQAGTFSLEDIASALSEKMIRRHPHVFGSDQVVGAGHVRENWEKIKAKERKERKTDGGLLDGVPIGMAGLLVSQRYGEKAASIRFDWKSAREVMQKVYEELRELEAAMESGDEDRMSDELGDVFFTLSNLARHLKLDAESVAKQGARKFAARVKRMEDLAREQGKQLHEYDSQALEKLWELAKA